MTRIRVHESGQIYDARQRPANEPLFPGEWETAYAIYTPEEVRVLGRHEGEYDPQHPGELEPDAYDRMSYKYEDHGRHLLHSGVE